MRFGILGPMEILVDGEWTGVARPLRRAVLGYLLLHPGRVVSSDRLVRSLWGDEEPASARAQVHSAMWHLRQALRPGGLADRLESRAGGYRLDVPDGDVDAGVFAAGTAAARAAAGQGRLAEADGLFTAAERLWRGEALGGAAGDYVPHARAALEERRLAAGEDHIDVLLRLGRHAELVGELTALVAEHPVRQRLTGLLMLALHRCGRPAEAAAAYRRLRTRLREEFGLDPSREMRDLHAAALRDDPALAAPPPPPRGAVPAGGQGGPAGGQGGPAGGPAGPVPAQLPRAPAGFVGRNGDLAALGGHAEPGALVILTGPPGVGKTALAVHWAQRAVPGFPDGQLHLNLRGYAPGRPLPPVEALAQLLRGLGTGPDRIPADADEAAALFRSTVAGRRVLVVLDNAADAAQVRPLLPGGAAAMTLVTSRSRLDGLVAHEGARRLTLRPLSTTDGVALLARLAGADRVSADAGAAAALADACAGLPLALRIAGTHLAADPTLTVVGYVAELRRGRVLAALALPEEEGPGVRSAFDLSYARLDGRARRQFRLLGVVPGPDITPDAAGALVGAPAGQARQLLDRLAAAHLADSAAQGRYHLHDLLRQYARELAADDRERDAARDRLFRWYLASSQAAARAITAWLPEPAADEGTVEPPRSFADATRARAWQEAERANLVAVALDAFDHRPRALGVRLAHSLNELFSRGWVGQWLSVAGAALAAARAEGEPADLAHAHIDLATAYHLAGRREDAARECEAALAVARHHGVRRAEAIAVGNLGIHRHEQGRIAEAAVHFEEFIRLSGTIGFSFGQATAHNNLGYLYHLMGRLDEARSHLAAALAHPVTAQRPPFRANTQACLAAVERDAGRLDDALAHGNAALASARAGRDRRSEAVALAALASVHSARSEFRHSVELGERALALARDGGLRETEAELLMGLSTAHRGLGELDAALDAAGRGAELARELGSGALEGQALTELAGTRLARGDVAAAARDAERARALLDGAGYGPARDRAAALLDQARTRTTGATGAVP